MKKIGVISAFDYPNDKRLVFGKKTLCYVESDMAKYLSRIDVMPVLIPDLPNSERINLLHQLDGFVFQGGTDLAPASYGEKPIGQWKGDPFRDEFELEIIDWCIKNNKPILGICRGFQLMNAYFGGSLYQDITTQKPEALNHRDAEAYDQLNHEIEFIDGSYFTRVHHGEKNNRVNSVHHQGVKTLGNELEVQAISNADNMIEAFIWKEASEGKVMGVQWHPEFFYNSNTPLINGELVYDEFLKHC